MKASASLACRIALCHILSTRLRVSGQASKGSTTNAREQLTVQRSFELYVGEEGLACQKRFLAVQNVLSEELRPTFKLSAAQRLD